MAPEVEIEWEAVGCGLQDTGTIIGRLIRPVRTVQFVKVVRRLDGGWSLWFCPKGVSIYTPYSIHRYGFDRAKPMAAAKRWATSHWQTIPRG